MSDANSSGDTQELEALFDSIASASASQVTPPAPPPAAPRPSLMRQALESDSSTEDSDDLQALFDSIAQQQSQPGDGAGERTGEWPAQGKVFLQVGQMARQLHDTLGANLGFIQRKLSA